MERILEILEENCNTTPQQIALMLDMNTEDVVAAIEDFKKRGIILKNKSVINWEKTDKEFVTAMIELKVTPQRGEGFDKIAERIYQYPEVKTVLLMAGDYDLSVTIEGKTMQEVALFVHKKLAPMDCIVSTATHFVLKKYKVENIVFEDLTEDDRQVITL